MIAITIQVFTLLYPMTLMGLSLTIGKLIPDLLGRGRKDKIQGLILYSLKWVSISAGALALVLIIFSPQLSSYLKLDDPRLIQISAVLIFLGALCTILERFYFGFQNMKKIFLTDLFGQIIKIVLTSSLILFSLGYFAVDEKWIAQNGIWIPLIGFVLCYVVVLLTRMDKKFLQISKKVVVDKKLILKYSVPAFITKFFSLLFDQTQFIILSVLRTVEETGVFAVGMKISIIIPIIPRVLSSALYPITSYLSSDKNKKRKQTYLIRVVFRYSLFLVLPIATFLILFSKYAVLLFSSLEYLPAMHVLPLLIIGGAIYGLGDLFRTSLYAIGKPNIERNIEIISTLMYIASAIPLTIYFSGIGLASSFLIATTFSFLINLIWIRKFLDIKLPLKDLGKMILSISISSIFLLLIIPHIDNLLVGIFFILLAYCIYLLALLRLNFYLEEDLKILDFLASKLYN